MKIEVITIGDELLSGTIVDTNFAWIGDQLWSRGYDLTGHMTVADDPERIGKALLSAADRSELVIVTGGLGATTDDITLEAAARAFSLPLVLNEQALSEIRVFFKKVDREMSPNNEKQALLPQGARRIENRVGTAPGCLLKFRDTDYFFLPGVPKEMKRQVEDAVLPFLAKADPGRIFIGKVFRCFGLPEASLDQELRGVKLGVRLGWRVVFPEILVKISTTDPQGAKELAKAEGLIRERIGKFIYAEGEESIEKVIGHLLTVRKETVAVAESCTGGLIANLITNVPGSSAYFERGMVTYSNRSKSELLGVDSQLIKKSGAVSGEVARAMAEKVRKSAKTSYGIGVTGIAGPTGGSESKPVGTVHIVVAGPKETKEKKYFFPHDREWFKLLAAHTALHKLRRIIQG